jgi:type II secretory pathway predicted ATPase ExeA
MALAQKSLIVRTLKLHGINQLDVVADMNAHGSHISKTSLLNFIRYEQWPARTNPKAIRESFTRLLGEDNQEEIEEMLKAAPTGVNATAAYQVLPLLAKYDLQQADLRRAMEATGVKLSPSAVSQLLRHGLWPKLIEKDLIKAAIEKFMSEHVSTSELLTMWHETKTKKGKATIKTKRTASKAIEPILTLELPEPEMLNPNTMKHFGLSRHPFDGNEINCEADLFMSDQQTLLREAMVQASIGGSILAVTGESGAGKTEIRKGFLDYINRNHPELLVIEPEIINKKLLTSEMIYVSLADELGMKIPQGLEQRARAIKRALKNSLKTGNKHVLMIEEAHDLTDDVIKYLKRIWELSDGFHKLISIVLIGQPELEQKLSPSNYNVREFSRRCNMMRLPPLGQYLGDYIAHKFARCHVDVAKVIDAPAIMAIKERLQGKVSYGVARATTNQDMTYPLIVNNFLINAMNEAAMVGESLITTELIKELK